jgi:predicted transcriptional regulator
MGGIVQSKAGRPTVISKSKFERASVNSGGITQNIAKKLGVARSTVCNYIVKNKEFCIPIITQEKEKIVDMAENSLFNQVKEQEAWATKYLLATKGRDRGYGEQLDINQRVLNVSIQLKQDEVEDLLQLIKEHS